MMWGLYICNMGIIIILPFLTVMPKRAFKHSLIFSSLCGIYIYIVLSMKRHKMEVFSVYKLIKNSFPKTQAFLLILWSSHNWNNLISSNSVCDFIQAHWQHFTLIRCSFQQLHLKRTYYCTDHFYQICKNWQAWAFQQQRGYSVRFLLVLNKELSADKQLAFCYY